MPPGAPESVLGRLRREAERAQIRARNGIRQVSGTASGPIAISPKTVVWERDGIVLYRYDSSKRTEPTPIVLVMSLVTKAYVFDLRPGSSLVADLLDAGFDVYLLDWGIPGPVESYNGIDLYCDRYLPRAVEAARRTSRAAGVTIFGYCLGALLAVLSAAGNPRMAYRNLVLLATPIDLRGLGPTMNWLGEGKLNPSELVDETGNIPASVIIEGFRAIQPTAPLSTYAGLWDSLANDQALEAYNALIGWSNDHIPFPGKAFGQMVALARSGELLEGRARLGTRTRDLAAVDRPVLSVIGARDRLVPPDCSRPLGPLLPEADFTEVELPAGHAGLFVGRSARTKCVPSIVSWLQQHS